jgi:phospholipid/cholesterol/gamma-HCH transport system substrate-binding protein
MLSNEQRIGLFFLIGLALLAVAVELTIGLGLFRRRYELFADFRDVQGLDRGADVRLAGLRAGRVEDMQIEGDHVRVRMAIDGHLTVRRDAVAKLDFRALSGERFVALTLGTRTAPAAEPGSVLEGETPAGLADAVDQMARVAQSIDELASNLDAEAGRLLVSLADVIEENRAALADLTSNVASITEKLDRGTGSLGRLLNDPRLYERVTETVTDVRQSVQDLGALAHNLRDGQGTLGKLMANDDTLYTEVQETLDNLAVAARNAQEITDGLRAGEGTLGKALVDASLYEQSLDTLRTANRAAQSVEDQAPISILGTIVTSLF